MYRNGFLDTMVLDDFQVGFQQFVCCNVNGSQYWCEVGAVNFPCRLEAKSSAGSECRHLSKQQIAFLRRVDSFSMRIPWIWSCEEFLLREIDPQSLNLSARLHQLPVYYSPDENKQRRTCRDLKSRLHSEWVPTIKCVEVSDVQKWSGEILASRRYATNLFVLLTWCEVIIIILQPTE